jgi:hypothetical protein
MKSRRLIRIFAAVISLATLGVGAYCWRQAYLWPFSTGSKDEAFLGATFGMSPPEVRRALQKYGAELLDYDGYTKTSTEHLISWVNFDPFVYSDERNSYSMFMPSIEMFGVPTEGEFEFSNYRLIYVGLHFGNFGKADSVIESISSALQAHHYTLTKREDSQTLPGGYTLNFVSPNVSAALWVYLKDPKKPIIVLSLNRPSDSLERKKRVQERERAAFGNPH